MSYRASFLFAAAAVISANGAAQHTPLTSQYHFNGLVINPAYAGSRDVLSASLTHRQQWVGFDGAPVTQTLSLHAPLARSKVGLGLVLYNDRIGVSNETGVFSNYAYRMRMGKGKLALGFGAGFTVLRANWSEVAVSQSGDQAFNGFTKGALRPNFSAGALYKDKVWFVGASIPFVLAHHYDPQSTGYDLRSEKTDLQPMLTGGYLFKVNADVKLKPTTLVRYKPESGVQADVSSNVIFRDKIWLGLSYRTSDAIIGMVEVLPTPQWRLGYSYDMGVSAINPYHNGSHELLVQYEFGYRIRVRDPRYF